MCKPRTAGINHTMMLSLAFWYEPYLLMSPVWEIRNGLNDKVKKFISREIKIYIYSIGPNMLILNWDVKKLQSAAGDLTKIWKSWYTQKNYLYTFGWLYSSLQWNVFSFEEKKGGTQLNYKMNKHNAGFVLNKRTGKENWCKCQACLSFETKLN